jgi:hypothetical protein
MRTFTVLFLKLKNHHYLMGKVESFVRHKVSGPLLTPDRGRFPVGKPVGLLPARGARQWGPLTAPGCLASILPAHRWALQIAIVFLSTWKGWETNKLYTPLASIGVPKGPPLGCRGAPLGCRSAFNGVPFRRASTGVPKGLHWGAKGPPLGCRIASTGVPNGLHWGAELPQLGCQKKIYIGHKQPPCRNCTSACSKYKIRETIYIKITSIRTVQWQTFFRRLKAGGQPSEKCWSPGANDLPADRHRRLSHPSMIFVSSSSVFKIMARWLFHNRHITTQSSVFDS